MTSFIESNHCVKISFFTRINELDELLEDGLLDHPALVEALSHLVEVDDGTDILAKFLDLEVEMEHSVTGDFLELIYSNRISLPLTLHQTKTKKISRDLTNIFLRLFRPVG